MKQLHLLVSLGVVLAIASGSFLLSGCEEIAQAATLKIPITISLEPESTSPSIPKTDQSCKDLSSEKDLIDNRDKISGGTVKEAYFQITDLMNPRFASGGTDDQVFTRCSFTLVFDEQYGDTKTYQLGTFVNVRLADLMNGRMAIPVSSDFNEAIKLIPRRPKFCINAVYGSFNTGPATASFIKGKIDVVIDFEASAI